MSSDQKFLTRGLLPQEDIGQCLENFWDKIVLTKGDRATDMPRVEAGNAAKDPIMHQTVLYNRAYLAQSDISAQAEKFSLDWMWHP